MEKYTQRYWEDITEGDEVPAIEFPVSVYRLVMEAGANRDFNSIHHNSEYAKSTGAQEMYANNFFLQGMWERTVREYIGLTGTFKHLKGFRMKAFNYAGDTIVTKGIVQKKWQERNEFFVELKMWSENSNGISVGPGSVVVTIPSKSATF